MKNKCFIIFAAAFVVISCAAGQEKRCKVCGNEIDEIESFSQSTELCHAHKDFKPCGGNCGKYVNPTFGIICPDCLKRREEEQRRQKIPTGNQQGMTASKACSFEFAGYRLGTFPDRRRGVQTNSEVPINLTKRFLGIFTTVSLKHGEKSRLLERMLFTSARLSDGEMKPHGDMVIAALKRTYGLELKSDGPNRWTCLTDNYRLLMKGEKDGESKVIKLLIIDLMSQEVERRMTANEPPLPDFVIVQKGEKVYPDGEYLNLENGMIYKLDRFGPGVKRVNLRALDTEIVRRNNGIVKVPSKIVHDDRFPKREQGTFLISDAIRMMNNIAGNWHDKDLKLVLNVSDFKSSDLDALPTNKWDNVGGIVFSKETQAVRTELEKKRLEAEQELARKLAESRERERQRRIDDEKKAAEEQRRQAEQERIELENRIKNTMTWESVVRDTHSLHSHNGLTALQEQMFWKKNRGERVYWKGIISLISDLGTHDLNSASDEVRSNLLWNKGVKVTVDLAGRTGRDSVRAEVVFQKKNDIERLALLHRGSEIMFEGTLEWGSLGGLWGGCTIELSQGRLIPHE
ncbi:MAG: hypothetical protein IJG84_25865 [Kiritimatiellae bacterium]|nr:hypothetical protein [Kiritimatiellia bacterium]